jgi:hypothetical protein
MISEKDKLAAKSVQQLKAAAKRLGGKLVTPDGKAKTKQQLINTIVMKKRLAGQSMGGNTTTKKVVGKKTIAKKAPARKTLGAGPITPAKAKALQKKRDLMKKYVVDIIDAGPNYAVWQNAQGAYKNAKAIEKLLRNW